MTAGLRRLGRCERGTVAIEFALVGLVAITLFLGIIEFGRVLYLRNEMSYAVDRGARLILTNPAATNSQVEALIRQATRFGTSASLLVNLDSSSVNGLPFRTVLVSYPVTLIIPGLTNKSFVLKIDRLVPLGS